MRWELILGTIRTQLPSDGIQTQTKKCYAVMPYSKVMAEENFMPSLYNNRMNLTIDVLDYACMSLHLYVINLSKRQF